MSLSENYKKALTALKDQAEAMRTGLQADNGNKDKLAANSALLDAQRRIVEVLVEARHIVQLILNPDVKGVAIPTMTEDDLERLLAWDEMSRSNADKHEIVKRITGLMFDGEPDWRAYHAGKLH